VRPLSGFHPVTWERVIWDAHWEFLNNDIEGMTCHERDDLAVALSEDALKDRPLYEID